MLSLGHNWSATSLKLESTQLPTERTTPFFSEINLGTNGWFLGFGYDYLINQDKDMRIRANVSYIPSLEGERRNINNEVAPFISVSSATTSSTKLGIYLQGQMFKLDRYGKLTYTLALDTVDYSFKFSEFSLVEDQLKEKLQTISFSVNYIFF